MAIAESILPEFDHETATTRALLERVPADKAEWKPHAKSMSLGHLAMHIANIPHWASITLERTEFDPNPPEGPQVTTPAYESGAKLLQTYDANVSAARALLARTTDAEFMVQWALKNGGKACSACRASRCSIVHPESCSAPSRAVERVPTPARCADPEYLRADSRYTKLRDFYVSPRGRCDAEFFEKNALRPCVLAVET
jgi:hypothetical protein